MTVKNRVTKLAAVSVLATGGLFVLAPQASAADGRVATRHAPAACVAAQICANTGDSGLLGRNGLVGELLQAVGDLLRGLL